MFKMSSNDEFINNAVPLPTNTIFPESKLNFPMQFMDLIKLLSALGPLQSVPMTTTDFGPSADQNLAQLSLPRKRRRAIGNLDNTLDGLVAKRADQMPGKRRYQTETEAIELPDDEAEIKRMEADPDVCTRMCSICGYQGKWVSEMIRHKRVHTNERPFKCRYCNRTSKWKADLIRHVAKIHGIRVVSKYSRSKVYKNGNKKGEAAQVDDDIIVLDTNENNNDMSQVEGTKCDESDSLSAQHLKRVVHAYQNQNFRDQNNQNQKHAKHQWDPILAPDFAGSEPEFTSSPSGWNDAQLALLRLLTAIPQLFPATQQK